MDSDKIKRLITEIYADQNEKEDALIRELPCHANQEAIVAYIEAEGKGEDPAVLYPDIFVQLQSCPSCFTLYEELKELLEMAQCNTWIEPPLPAEFVLPPFIAEETEARTVTAPTMAQSPNDAKQESTSVKAPPPRPMAERMIADAVDDAYAIPWHITAIGELVVTLSQEFLNSFSPQPMPNYLKAVPDDIFTIQSPALSDDLQVTISAQTMRQNRDKCKLTVIADIPSRGGWPNLGGTIVTILFDNGNAQTHRTDAFGKVHFEEIVCSAFSQLQIVVAP